MYVILCANPASASSMMHTLRTALLKGDRARGMIPSFFETLESPAVEEYKHQQAIALANVIKGNHASRVNVEVATKQKEETKTFEKKTSFKEELEEEAEQIEKMNVTPKLSDSIVNRTLGASMLMSDAEFEELLLLDDSEDETESDDEDDKEEVAEAPMIAPKVSQGLFGMKVNGRMSKGRKGVKNLSSSIRKKLL